MENFLLFWKFLDFIWQTIYCQWCDGSLRIAYGMILLQLHPTSNNLFKTLHTPSLLFSGIPKYTIIQVPTIIACHYMINRKNLFDPLTDSCTVLVERVCKETKKIFGWERLLYREMFSKAKSDYANWCY